MVGIMSGASVGWGIISPISKVSATCGVVPVDGVTIDAVPVAVRPNDVTTDGSRQVPLAPVSTSARICTGFGIV